MKVFYYENENQIFIQVANPFPWFEGYIAVLRDESTLLLIRESQIPDYLICLGEL
jgi:hypothetical protein